MNLKEIELDEFSQYKRLIMSEINTLKHDFSEFKKHVEATLSDIKISIAILSTKLLVMSAISATVAGSVVSFIVDKVLK